MSIRHTIKMPCTQNVLSLHMNIRICSFQIFYHELYYFHMMLSKKVVERAIGYIYIYFLIQNIRTTIISKLAGLPLNSLEDIEKCTCVI